MKNIKTRTCLLCKKEYKPSSTVQKYCGSYRKKLGCSFLVGKNYKTEYKKETRIEVLSRYSGNPPKCSCCGEKHIEFLVIDHIEGGGYKHRKFLKKHGGTQFYLWLKKNNYPKEYRVLCMNCNFSLGIRGYCPHQQSL